MVDAVKRNRRYDSPRRREQAAATRRAILEAAERLFVRDGYPATTMAAIAAEANVALKTVYVAFATKSGLLRALWNLRLRDDRAEIPVAQQGWFREVLDEPDAERQLRLNARNSRAGKLRVAALGQVILTAAPVDSDIAALWARIQSDYRENQRAVVSSLAAKGALRHGLDVERAADMLWAINHPQLWLLLVGERGWTAEQYEEWTAELACEQLLARPAARTRAARRRR